MSVEKFPQCYPKREGGAGGAGGAGPGRAAELTRQSRCSEGSDTRAEIDRTDEAIISQRLSHTP